jgi:hypothetical protein
LPLHAWNLVADQLLSRDTTLLPVRIEVIAILFQSHQPVSLNKAFFSISIGLSLNFGLKFNIAAVQLMGLILLGMYLSNIVLILYFY